MSTSSNDGTAARVLVVCAHPDDETLWFSSVLARYHTDVICVTCGWDDDTRARRQRRGGRRTLGVWEGQLP